MFNSTLLDFDLGLLEPHQTPVCNDGAEHNQMEDEKMGWLEATSDLQAFMDIGALPEIKGDEDVDNVINDVEKLIQEFDDQKENVDQTPTLPLDEEIFPPEEMAAAEQLLDDLLKSNDLDLSSFEIEPESHQTDDVHEEKKPVLNDSGFIDMTNVTKIIKEDGQEIYIMIAPPSPEVAEMTTHVTAPESLASVASSESDDSEWSPGFEKVAKGRPPVKRSKAKSARKSPYITDKKERKKLQNVEAARRYRDKKKAEQSGAEVEEQALAARNKILKTEVSDLEAEVKTLKKLMVELGLLKKP